MGLIKAGFRGPYGVEHSECYINVHSYTVNTATKNARVTMLFYHSAKEKDLGSRPILSETYTFTGELYDNIFVNSPQSPGDTVLAGIYSNITSEDLTDNTIFRDTLNVHEVMLKEYVDEGLAKGDEIGRMEAADLGLIEDTDFESVDFEDVDFEDTSEIS